MQQITGERTHTAYMVCEVCVEFKSVSVLNNGKYLKKSCVFLKPQMSCSDI